MVHAWANNVIGLWSMAHSHCQGWWRHPAAQLMLLPLLALPVTLGVQWLSERLTAPAPREVRAVPVPRVESRSAVDAVEAFAQRLESVFGLGQERAAQFSDWIMEASVRHDVSPEVLASLIHTESSFRKQVRSWAGAIGPAQVKPRYWRDFCGGFDLYDPEHNIYCGAQVLDHYRRQCGGLECALRLYNVGPGNLRLPRYQRASSRYLARIETHRSRIQATTPTML